MLSHDYWSITNTRVINTDSIDLNQSDHLDSSLWLYFSDPETVATNYIQWISRSPFLSTGSSVLFLKEHTWYTWTLAPHSLHTTVIFVGIFGPFINCKYPFIWRKTPPIHTTKLILSKKGSRQYAIISGGDTDFYFCQGKVDILTLPASKCARGVRRHRAVLSERCMSSASQTRASGKEM